MSVEMNLERIVSDCVSQSRVLKTYRMCTGSGARTLHRQNKINLEDTVSVSSR